MTTRQMIILLESKGYRITYITRPDGGVRIKEIDGKVYKLSEGNKKARQLMNRPLTVSQLSQRSAGRAKVVKGTSKILSKAHKETMKTRKKAGASPKQIAKYQQEYQAEQSEYRKMRQQGKTAVQARKALRKKAKATASPTLQHARYWQEKGRPATGFEFPNISELLSKFSYSRTLDLLSAFAPNRDSEDSRAIGLMEDEAKGILYDYMREFTEEGQNLVIADEVVPFENRLRRFLEDRGAKAPLTPIGDILSFLFINHQTRLYNPFRRKYKGGKVSASEVSRINSSLEEIYGQANISHRKALSANLLTFIKQIVYR